jgi:hypothetical protein
MIKKNDFINVIFESVSGIQASELINLMNLFTTSFEDVINYDDFLRILYKFGEGPTQHPSSQMMINQHQDSLNNF